MAVSFIKKGADSTKAAQQAEAEAEARKDEQGKMWRFYLDKGEQNVHITFIDGNLDEEGHLVPPRFYEHGVMVNNRVQHFVCPEKSFPDSGDSCPICASGDRPSLVAVFTIIDHREFESKKDKNKVYKDRPKLLVAKGNSFEMLAKIAQKRGGLAGAQFEVSRIGEKAPVIGDMYDFETKTDIALLMKKHTITVKDPKTNAESTVCLFVPADYDKEIIFRTGDELRKLGYWGAKQASGGPAGNQPPAKTGTTNYDNDL